MISNYRPVITHFGVQSHLYMYNITSLHIYPHHFTLIFNDEKSNPVFKNIWDTMCDPDYFSWSRHCLISLISFIATLHHDTSTITVYRSSHVLKRNCRIISSPSRDSESYLKLVFSDLVNERILMHVYRPVRIKFNMSGIFVWSIC